MRVSIQENRKTVETMWQALTDMDWEILKSCLLGAQGPENVVKRLAIAFDHLVDHRHTIHHLACEGDVVFLDHTEGWTFKTGEKVEHTFATMHEMKDGKVVKWSDYWDVSKFVSQFPQWFLEEMARRSQADFSD
jgi:ketosteroid isomerase-like protein